MLKFLHSYHPIGQENNCFIIKWNPGNRTLVTSVYTYRYVSKVT